jgi:pimeloyl-ACP methyl ester carboxylesterase
VQRSFIYFPVPLTHSGLPEKTFEHDGHTIKVSILNNTKSKAIIYFGGNAENVEYNATAFSKLFSEYAVYLVKYRGYGGSSGTPSEQAIYSDALHIYDIISDSYEEISIIGRSLGSAVATYVASGRDIEKLVLITPFDSIQSIAQSQFPIYPVSLLLKDKYDSYSQVKDIKAETMIIAAENDKIIDISHTMRLMEGFTSGVLFHVIKDTGHNDISNNPAYHSLLGDFF